MAANIFTGTTNSNWGTATNWSLGAVPTAADANTATFNATSPNCTVNVTAVCNNIDFTGYTNTITMTNGITVSGNVTFVSTMASRVAGSGSLTINATSAITTNGATWNNALLFSTSSTKTITGTLTVTGLFTSVSSTQTVNGGTLILNGGMTISGNMSGGTTAVTLGGGTWSGTAFFGNPLTFAGNLIISGAVAYGGSTLTYTSGIITTTGSTVSISSATINVAAITFNNITVPAGSTGITLSAALNLSGTLTAIPNAIFTGAFNITVASIAVSNAISGTASVILSGGGTWSGTGTVTTNLTFAGNTTISGTVGHATGTLTYSSGTITTTGSTVNIQNSTLDVSGITFNNVTLSAANTTQTLLSNLNIGGLWTVSGTNNNIFNGAFNINAAGGITVATGSILSGTSSIVLSGGTWSGAGTIRNNLTINTTGTVTVSGTVIYNTGTLTYITGTVLTGGSTLSTNLIAVTFNTDGIAWNNVSLGVLTTLTSNLTVNGLLTTSTVINGANIYANGGITVGNNSSGTTVIWLQGGTWSGVNMIRNNTFINGNITISGSVAFNGATLTYTSGTVVAKGSTLNINGVSTTLINIHKINFDTVIITSSLTVIMNEFFSGSPNLPVKVQVSSAATNYTITFQNGFEKIAKYVKVSNLTLTNTSASRGSLLILNNKGKYFTGGNNVGNIRYINQSPNGISKGNPTIPNSMTAPIGGYISDPIFN